MTESSELDCKTAEETRPRVPLFHRRSVVLASVLSSRPPMNARKSSSRTIMPNRTVARPAAISVKLGIATSPITWMAMATGRIAFQALAS